MDELLNRVLIDPVADWTLHQLLEWATRHFYAFTLVLVRMSGMMIIGPVFGQPVVPINLRVLLVVAMAILITPSLYRYSEIGFERLDVNNDGRLVRSEVPPQLSHRFEESLERFGRPEDSSVSAVEYLSAFRVPSSVFEYAGIAAREFSLGLVLGLGVLTILSGLQLAGDIIDQQTGIALGEVFSPGFDTSGSISGQMLFVLGMTMLLVLEPLNGHLLMVSALMETFQTFPVGEAYVSASAVDLLRDLVHQSLVLAVQITAPLLATVSLVSLTMGFLGQTVPQINVLIVGFPIRAMINLFILAMSLSGVGLLVVDVVPTVIDDIRAVLTAIP